MEENGQTKISNDVTSMLYYDGDVKPIDVMLQQFGNQHVISWCVLNAFKYLWRCMKKHKTPIEDLKKAQYYINKVIELYEKENNTVQAS